MSNYFNNKGEINASSVKEAMQSIVKIASMLEEGQPSNSGLVAPVANESRRDELVTRALSTNEGKIALAQAMANPIR